MQPYFLTIFILIAFLFIHGCSQTNQYAPVETAWYQGEQKSDKHVVTKGETLYAIAWRYDLDYRTLAEINHLEAPFHLTVGQSLNLESRKPIKNQKVIKNIQVTQPSTNSPKAGIKLVTKLSNVESKMLPRRVGKWVWPIEGRLVSRFAANQHQKGIDIVGKQGDPVVAAAKGTVAYSGDGLKGYGNLIIIKHSDELLSAYAHNRSLLVREGEIVEAGQRVAIVGNNHARKNILHFEIRKAGKAVDPLRYLPKRS